MGAVLMGQVRFSPVFFDYNVTVELNFIKVEYC